jgi:hypothetical protein
MKLNICRFPHDTERSGHKMAFHKSITPTRTIFMAGLHVAGACKLPPEWNGIFIYSYI